MRVRLSGLACPCGATLGSFSLRQLRAATSVACGYSSAIHKAVDTAPIARADTRERKDKGEHYSRTTGTAVQLYSSVGVSVRARSL